MSTSPPHRAVIPRNFPAYVSQYQQPVTQTKSLPQATFLSVIQFFILAYFKILLPYISKPCNNHCKQQKCLAVPYFYIQVIRQHFYFKYNLWLVQVWFQARTQHILSVISQYTHLQVLTVVIFKYLPLFNQFYSLVILFYQYPYLN